MSRSSRLSYMGWFSKPTCSGRCWAAQKLRSVAHKIQAIAYASTPSQRHTRHRRNFRPHLPATHPAKGAVSNSIRSRIRPNGVPRQNRRQTAVFAQEQGAAHPLGIRVVRTHPRWRSSDLYDAAPRSGRSALSLSPTDQGDNGQFLWLRAHGLNDGAARTID